MSSHASSGPGASLQPDQLDELRLERVRGPKKRVRATNGVERSTASPDDEFHQEPVVRRRTEDRRLGAGALSLSASIDVMAVKETALSRTQSILAPMLLASIPLTVVFAWMAFGWVLWHGSGTANDVKDFALALLGQSPA